MANLREEANELDIRLKQLVTATVDELTVVGNRLQQLSNRAPGALALCDFNAPQRMRRLSNIPAKAWGPLEIRWCRQALQEIEGLKKAKSHQASLALACYGVFTKDLQKLIREVEAAAFQPGAGAPAPEPEMVKRKPATNSNPGDEILDAETLDALEALQAEAAQLQ